MVPLVGTAHLLKHQQQKLYVQTNNKLHFYRRSESVPGVEQLRVGLMLVAMAEAALVLVADEVDAVEIPLLFYGGGHDEHFDTIRVFFLISQKLLK